MLVNGHKHNLFSISQFCDKGHRIIFECMSCQVINVKTNNLIFIGHCQANVYVVYFTTTNLTNCDDFSKLYIMFRHAKYIKRDD